MKTPEEMAEEYLDQDKVVCAAINRDAEDLVKDAFLAGYQAAKEKPSPSIEDHSGDGRSCCAWCSEVAFRHGYQTAKELYAAKLKEANDTVAGMVDECEGLKTIIYDHDETNLPTSAKWISVKERLPNVEKTSRSLRRESSCVLIVSYDNVYVAHLCEDWSDRSLFIFEACNCNCRAFDMEIDEWKLDQVTHWQPLPAPPKEEK